MLEHLLRKSTSGCISDFALDKWRAGELDTQVIESLERHLAECTDCKARSTALDEQATAFLRQVQSPRLADRTHRAPGAVHRSTRVSRARRFGVAIATLAVAAGVVLVARYPNRFSDTSEQTRSKGSARFGFHVKRGQQVVLGVEGQEVHPHDQLRFFVSTGKPKQLAILSRDGSGTVSEYFPGSGRSQRVDATANHNLDSSVDLDTTLGQEELFAVFCDSPFETEPLRRELVNHGTLRAPLNCSMDQLSIVKRSGQ